MIITLLWKLLQGGGALVLRAVPSWLWRVLAYGAVLVALCGWCWLCGAEHVQSQWNAQRQAVAIRVVRLQASQAAASVRVQTRTVVRLKMIHDQARVLAQEIPLYVDAEDDAACSIGAGFVRVWNAANTGASAAGASRADGAPSGVELSDLAREHGREAEYCRGLETQVMGWQDWYRAQQRVQQ